MLQWIDLIDTVTLAHLGKAHMMAGLRLAEVAKAGNIPNIARMDADADL